MKGLDGLKIKRYVVCAIAEDEDGNEVELEFVPDVEVKQRFQNAVSELMDEFGATERIDADA